MIENQLEITSTSLNQIEDIIKNGNDRYSLDENAEDNAFNKAFKNFPLNKDPEIVAMKIALVDMTNSTNLGRILGNKDYLQNGKHIVRKVFTLSDLIRKIIFISDFDERVKEGDIALVSELTKWSKERGANLMSFFSKYCLYHNYCTYGKDDYSIYDSVLQQNLGAYLNLEEFKQLFPDIAIRETSNIAKLVANRIAKMKESCDYEAYWNLIDKILNLKNISDNQVMFKRRKLDHFVWYLNRTKMNQPWLNDSNHK